MKTDISVIIPLLNEEQNILELCTALEDFAKDKPYKLELIFVDDGSTDRTVSKLKDYRFFNVAAKVVILSQNYGAHVAIRAGMTVVASDFTIFFSGDLQEPVEIIDIAYNRIKEGYDIIYIRKLFSGDSIFSKIYAQLIRTFAVTEYPNGGISNMMFSLKVRKLLLQNQEANSSVPLQALTMGFKHIFIDCRYSERKAGESGWTFSKKMKLFIDSFVAFSFAPIRAVSSIGIFFSIIGTIYAVYIIIVRAFNIFPFSTGFPTLISVILIGFGITNISLGIIAEYIWRILDVARNRPIFIVDEICDIVQHNDV